MNNATEGQKKLLILLLMVLVFFAAYRFGYLPMQKETDKILEENAAIQEEIDDLKRKVKNQENYEKQRKENEAAVREVIAQFGPGVTPEKSILFFVALQEAAQMQIPTISFGDASVLYTTSALTGAFGIPYIQSAGVFNIAYTTSYDGLKKCIDFINRYPEKMHLDSLSVSYNAETDSLSGSLSLKWYALTGTDKQYRFEDLKDIAIGNENLFRTGGY